MSSARETAKRLSALALIGVVVASLCVWVYASPSPSVTLPNTPFLLYYLKEEYVVRENGTATLDSMSFVAVWSLSYGGTSISIYVREGLGDVQVVEVNPFTRENNASEGGILWWIPPMTPLGLMIDIEGKYFVMVGECEEWVNKLAREAVILFYSDGESVSVAKYDKGSGFLIDLKVRQGDSITVYRLQSVLGAQLSLSKYYYLRAVLLFSLVPSLIVFFLSMPKIRRRN
ncbi:MAG: hypothetical protein KIH01_02285 [Candidatus Freyarchaeota archaeon]|nr:hypothetical protein [Candidatus Jordarchaeia archaeon]